MSEYKAYDTFVLFIIFIKVRGGRGGVLRSKSTLAYLEGGREGQKSDFFCVRNMWMPPSLF